MPLPFRERLLTRLLAVSVLVAICSISATAWLAAQVTSGAIREEQGKELDEDARVYDTLLGVGARGPGWHGAGRTVRELAKDTGQRIALTRRDGRVLADSAPGRPLPRGAAGVVDPLAADRSVVRGDASGIDPRAIGPYRLTAAERATLRTHADEGVQCLLTRAFTAHVTLEPSGRPTIRVANDPDSRGARACPTPALDQPTATERTALTALEKLVTPCLRRQQLPPVAVRHDFTWRFTAAGAFSQDTGTHVTACVTAGRREQLTPMTSSAALLYLGDGETIHGTGLSLTPDNLGQLTATAAGILAVTVVVTVLASSRLVRPLRALTESAQRMKSGDEPATSTTVAATGGEIGRLARAFQELNAHRAALEAQRTALVNDVAHELRSPLSNIRGWLEAAQDGIVGTDAALISSLHEEALQLQHLIDDLQDLAAADAETLRLYGEPLDLHALLQQTASAHRTQADASGVTLSVCAEGAGTWTADPVRMRQVLGNLLSNALRHTAPGGAVTLRATRTAARVAIEVRDTGTGIPPEQLPHVFDRFWRGEKSRNRSTGGSGLGLSIVRKLVEAHGGTVEVTSEPGHGAAFHLLFPADPALRPTSGCPASD
ncbi:ATP-binding protein [Streptomyces sp. NPDC048182]|uniref:HAMP domain-containing sensor histidine kinase n=1 Tax=Streptomyces sp. NPDC048182 TaxID=3365507 RepID=UPI003716C4F5